MAQIHCVTLLAGASDSDPDPTSPARQRHEQAELPAGSRASHASAPDMPGSSSIGRGSRFLDRPSKKRHRYLQTLLSLSVSYSHVAKAAVFNQILPSMMQLQGVCHMSLQH